MLPPKWLIREFGCSSCVWKFHGLCPKDLSKDMVLEEGFCVEFMEFLNDLCEGGSQSALREKLVLYQGQLQLNSDYKRFKRLECEYDDCLRNPGLGRHPDLVLVELQAYKLWWSRISECVVKGLGRVVDRESRLDKGRGIKQLSVQDLNRFIGRGSDELEGKE